MIHKALKTFSIFFIFFGNVEAKQTVIASFYGEESGKLTASGEKFNPKLLTAAHKKFKFGTKLRVTNKDNGKSVIVKVNDRGPYKKGRSLDLSKAAAKIIGMIDTGVQQVYIEVIK